MSHNTTAPGWDRDLNVLSTNAAGGPEGGGSRTSVRPVMTGTIPQNGQQEPRPPDGIVAERLQAELVDVRNELENEKERSKAALEAKNLELDRKEEKHRKFVLAEQKRWEEKNNEDMAVKLRKCAEDEREKARKELVDEMKRAGEEKALEGEKYRAHIAELEGANRCLAKENEEGKKSQQAWIHAITEWNDRGDESHLRQIMRRLGIRESSSPGGGFWNQRKTIQDQGEEILKLRHEVNTLRHEMGKARNKRDEWKSRAAYLEENYIALETQFKKNDSQLRACLSAAEADQKKMKAIMEERDYELSCLKADKESIERDLEKAKNVEKRASTERDVAVEERARLFRMLQSATVKRTGPPQGVGGFPNGDEIKRFAMKVQPGDFLYGLRDTMDEDRSLELPTDKLQSYHFVLDELIVPCWKTALSMLQKHEDRKLGELSVFIESSLGIDEMRERVYADNTLLQLFWAFSMQEGTKGLPQQKGQLLKRPGTTQAVPPARMNLPVGAAVVPKPPARAAKFQNDDDSDDDDIEGVGQDGDGFDRKPPAGVGEDSAETTAEAGEEDVSGEGALGEDVDAIPSSPYVAWARGAEVVQSLRELDSPTWDSFTEDLMLLALFCKFSDPACYLWPPIGEEVAFSTELFKLEAVAGTRPRSGQSVRVLFPGLYFVNPRSDPTIEPMCKAVVIVGNDGGRRGGNSRKSSSARNLVDKGDDKKSFAFFSFSRK